MAITIRDVAKGISEKIDTREKAKIVTIGFLRLVDGSVTVPRRPNYVWFQEYAQPESSPLAVVFNDVVSPVANLPVIVTSTPTPPFRRRVVGVYTDATLENNPDPIGNFNIPLHAQTHQYPSETNAGNDKVLIFQPALQMLKTVPSSGLTIKVKGLIYEYNFTYYRYTDSTLDLTTSIPGAGLVRYTLVYLDVATGLLGISDGTPVLNNGAIPIPVPDLVADTIASSYVKLADTTLTITTSEITDARSFLSVGRYRANQTGDILISIDGETFQAGQPVADLSGILVLDGLGHLVVV